VAELTSTVGNLTIHFVGDNAATLQSEYNRVYNGSETFQKIMGETGTYYKDIYVGSSVQELQALQAYPPNLMDPANQFDRYMMENSPAYGKSGGPDTWFIVAP
jgi:hypothetical protein